MYRLFSIPPTYSRDTSRRISIFYTILFGFWTLAIFAVINWITTFHGYLDGSDGRVPFFIPLTFLLLPTILYILTRVGYYYLAAHSFLALLSIASLHASFTWGVELYQTIAIYALIIIMSGILITPIAATVYSFTIIFVLSSFYGLQINGLVSVDYSWKTDPFFPINFVILMITYAIIALISWLSSREIEKSLTQAHLSEQEARSLANELAYERDSLEKTIKKRTQALRQAQLEKMQQMYSMVEIGRATAGLLHDINSPLSTISLNLDTIQSHTKKNASRVQVEELSKAIKKATTASNKISSMVRASRNQILTTPVKNKFDLVEEINQLILLFNHRIEHAHILIDLDTPKKCIISSYQSQFAQVIANIISNAIDSFKHTSNQNRKIKLKLVHDVDKITLKIEDNGIGIKSSVVAKIFDPLFTTKSNYGGTGLGLYITKKIIEDTLKGTIKVQSKDKTGTSFLVTIPTHHSS